MQGQASDIAIHAEEFIKLKALLNRLLAQHTGQSVEIIGTLAAWCSTCECGTVSEYDVWRCLFVHCELQVVAS